jgi:ubiquitin-protein ligase
MLTTIFHTHLAAIGDVATHILEDVFAIVLGDLVSRAIRRSGVVERLWRRLRRRTTREPVKPDKKEGEEKKNDTSERDQFPPFDWPRRGGPR